jgi:enamine deaminase RidA (YjgF/YER057c/UK114 family)
MGLTVSSHRQDTESGTIEPHIADLFDSLNLKEIPYDKILLVQLRIDNTFFEGLSEEGRSAFLSTLNDVYRRRFQGTNGHRHLPARSTILIRPEEGEPRVPPLACIIKYLPDDSKATITDFDDGSAKGAYTPIVIVDDGEVSDYYISGQVPEDDSVPLEEQIDHSLQKMLTRLYNATHTAHRASNYSHDQAQTDTDNQMTELMRVLQDVTLYLHPDQDESTALNYLKKKLIQPTEVTIIRGIVPRGKFLCEIDAIARMTHAN